MIGLDPFDYRGERAVLATMHGKERVITPLLSRKLGLCVDVCPGLDTDRFGTFSRDVARSGTPIETARIKISAAFALMSGVRIGIASEGSYGPHPSIPIVPFGSELVLLVDRETGLELTGHDASLFVNFAHAVVSTVDEAKSFAQKATFPEYGLIVSGYRNGMPAPEAWLDKTIETYSELEKSVQRAIAVCGSALIENDMRANRNPTRMCAIERATGHLVHRLKSRCPVCAYPGFDVAKVLPGLRCELCGLPTRATKAMICRCSNCTYELQKPNKSSRKFADPTECDNCNP
jgi:hypothetical protein